MFEKIMFIKRINIKFITIYIIITFLNNWKNKKIHNQFHLFC